MPASPSRNPNAEPGRRFYGFTIAFAALLALALVVFALPASIAVRFLPKGVEATDISGSVWHGSIGSLTIDNTAAGALEWHVDPLALLRARLACDAHWVNIGFVLDGSLTIGGSSIEIENLHGGGPLQDLAQLNIGRGWHGDVAVTVDRVELHANRFAAAHGRLSIEHLSSARVGGDDLGAYVLQLGDDAVKDDGSALAQVQDQGGPLQVQGTVSIVPSQHLATLSGTLKERGQISAALQHDLDDLARMRGRDSQGRIPLDFELSL